MKFIKNYLKRGDDLPSNQKAKEKVTIALEIILVISLLLEIFKIVDSKIINAIFLPSIIIYIFLNLTKTLNKYKIISLILIFILSVSIYMFIIGIL